MLGSSLLDKAVHGNPGKYKTELSKMSLYLSMLSNLTRDLTSFYWLNRAIQEVKMKAISE